MCVCVTLWILACQAPLFVEFSRQEYWSRLPFSTSGDLSTILGIECVSLVSPELAGSFLTNWPCKDISKIFERPIEEIIKYLGRTRVENIFHSGKLEEKQIIWL